MKNKRKSFHCNISQDSANMENIQIHKWMKKGGGKYIHYWKKIEKNTVYILK